MKKTPVFKGFTIVELLVVIVVIAILAAITIVSYSGITSRATASSMQSDLNNNAKLLKLYYAEYGSYPTTMLNNCPTAPHNDPKYCLKASESNNIELKTPLSASSFTLYSTKGTTQGYYITDNSSPAMGGRNLLTAEDASFEGGTTGIWTVYQSISFTITNYALESWHGSKCFSYTFTGDGGSNGVVYTTGTNSIISTGSEYTLSAWLKAGNAGAIGKTTSISLRGNSSGHNPASITLTDEWQKVTTTKTFAMSDTSMRYAYLALTNNLEVGDIVLVDAVKLEVGSVASSF